MMGWGCGADAGRRLARWLLGGLVVAVSVLLWNGCESAEARVDEQGTYCLRIGPSGGSDGTVALFWGVDGKRQGVNDE